MVSEFTVEVGKHRAQFPGFELMPDQRAAELDQRPDVAEIDDLLQSEIGDFSASLVAVIEDEIGYRPPVISF